MLLIIFITIEIFFSVPCRDKLKDISYKMKMFMNIGYHKSCIHVAK